MSNLSKVSKVRSLRHFSKANADENIKYFYHISATSRIRRMVEKKKKNERFHIFQFTATITLQPHRGERLKCSEDSWQNCVGHLACNRLPASAMHYRPRDSNCCRASRSRFFVSRKSTIRSVSATRRVPSPSGEHASAV